jgi:murein DD-endopeptidase MepM/ murein hydrolase activator NlpD
MTRWAVVSLGLILLLAACTPAATPAGPPTPGTVTESGGKVHTAAAHRTTAPTPTVSIAVATAAVATATEVLPSPTVRPPFTICSPLEGISLAELGQPDLLKNPFEQPRPGMDDGHHGADFAYWSRGERSTMQGLPVYSVLSGRVAGVLENRLPYGNTVIIETPLDSLPDDWLAALDIPAPQPTVPAAPNLICPPDQVDYGQPDRRSLYLLYAHLDSHSALVAGQSVACGGLVGEVGTTGKSVNYHLHLETRVGPAGAVFPALAHYEASASEAEMSAYCTWRVSGLFAMFDPMQLFDQ